MFELMAKIEIRGWAAAVIRFYSFSNQKKGTKKRARTKNRRAKAAV